MITLLVIITAALIFLLGAGVMWISHYWIKPLESFFDNTFEEL